MTRTVTSPYDVAEHLRTPEEMAAYLEACMEEADGDAAFIAKALGPARVKTARNPYHKRNILYMPISYKFRSGRAGGRLRRRRQAAAPVSGPVRARPAATRMR